MSSQGSSPEPKSGEQPDDAASLGDAIARRMELFRDEEPENAHKPPLRLFPAEVLNFLEPIRRKFRPPPAIEKADDPRVVILLPGFATHPFRMRYLAEQLERGGHTVKKWGLGYNFGPTPENFDAVASRLCAVKERYGQKVVLIGWSLGGIFAREVAKRHPECVAKVITMGTPFSHTPHSNNLWRIYQFVVGHRVDSPPVEVDMPTKPPVETVAFWSPRDGAVSRRSACGLPGERDRAVALRCTHMGFSNSPEVIMALDEELRR